MTIIPLRINIPWKDYKLEGFSYLTIFDKDLFSFHIYQDSIFICFLFFIKKEIRFYRTSTSLTLLRQLMKILFLIPIALIFYMLGYENWLDFAVYSGIFILTLFLLFHY